MKLGKIILWDFDGVLMNSNLVRDQGFVEVLKEFPKYQVEKLLAFHKKNGGLSRYVKFRYFFEEIRKEEISEKEVNNLANKFSIIMKKILVDESLLIDDSIQFVKKHHQDFYMHIVSGSDEKELRFLCQELKISQYFISIHGSPTAKNDLVRNLLNEYNYQKLNCILIGDSINDFEAATVNKISFYGYNNMNLKSKNYIYNFNNFNLV